MEKSFEILQKINRSVNSVLTSISALLAFLCMLLITMDVAGRYLFSKPISGTLEITEATLPIIVFFVFAYYEIHRGHIKITIIYSRLPPKVRDLSDILSQLFTFAVFALLAWLSFTYAWGAWVSKRVSWGSFPMPLWIPQAGISVGCLTFALHSLGSFLSKSITFVQSR